MNNAASINKYSYDQITSFVKALTKSDVMHFYTTFQQFIIPIFPIHQLIVRLTPPDFSHPTPSSLPSSYLDPRSITWSAE